jgi:hypothetical protein
MTSSFVPTGAHLVGSMALPSVASVLESAGAILGRRLARIPDGEPGGRNLWVSWQYPLLRANPFLKVDAQPDRQSASGFRLLCLSEGVKPEDVAFGELGYAREARASYIDFTRARERGLIPGGCRFQVCLPTPFAVTYPFVSSKDLLAVEAAYTAAMLRELDALFAEIPAANLALQWDICIEMVMWDGRFAAYPSPFADLRRAVVDRIVGLCRALPADVELGFHLCYGDWEARHFIEPIDAGAMVELSNALTDAIGHPIAFLHMPVPIDRSDDAYFNPLAGLRLDPACQLYLGVVHHADGVEGARLRIAAASRHVQAFGIASECGLGRCKTPNTVLEILRLHAGVSEEPRPKVEA